MSKRIYLLRHGEASNAANTDKARPLTDQGKSDTIALGKYLCSKKYEPELCMVSTATRTQQSFENICANAKIDKVQHKDEIYSASRGQLFSMLQDIDDTVSSVLLIGHNPAIYELAAMLAANGADNFMSRLSMGHPPASFCAFDAPCEKWADLDPDACSIIDHAVPFDYNGSERPTRWM